MDFNNHYTKGFSSYTITSTYSQEKIPSFISSFDPEGALCIGKDVGGLNLEDVRWHAPVRLDAHIFVNDWGREALTLGLRSADAATASRERWRWDRLCDGWNAARRPLTFQWLWCKAPHRGFWDSIGSLRNNSSTFPHLDSYESPSHIRLYLAIACGQGKTRFNRDTVVAITKHTTLQKRMKSTCFIERSCENMSRVCIGASMEFQKCRNIHCVEIKHKQEVQGRVVQGNPQRNPTQL